MLRLDRGGIKQMFSIWQVVFDWGARRLEIIPWILENIDWGPESPLGWKTGDDERMPASCSRVICGWGPAIPRLRREWIVD